jgi:putative (di)nucleoside polyphosphate hydrolase
MSTARDLPYRPCVGVMLLGPDGRAFIGRRTEGPEIGNAAYMWQMPQGGLDAGEEPYDAALRELYEETNVRSVEPIAEMKGWISYDLPEHLVGVAWGGRYRGQRQKWFLLRFTGAVDEIDVLHPAEGAHPAEFVEWRWEDPARLPELVIPFKRAVYERIVAEFAPLIGQGAR